MLLDKKLLLNRAPSDSVTPNSIGRGRALSISVAKSAVKKSESNRGAYLMKFKSLRGGVYESAALLRNKITQK